MCFMFIKIRVMEPDYIAIKKFHQKHPSRETLFIPFYL